MTVAASQKLPKQSDLKKVCKAVFDIGKLISDLPENVVAFLQLGGGRC